MKTQRGFLLFLYILSVVVFFAVSVHGQESLLPAGLVMEDRYTPGIGQRVGNVLLVEGKAVIIHKDNQRGYWIRKGLGLYNGDRIITMPDGRVRLSMDDGSEITIAPDSEFSIELFYKKMVGSTMGS